MAALTTSNRLTSKDIRVEYIPLATAAATHVETIAFSSNITGGTFNFRVNGEQTAAITFSATAATLVTNVNAALDALPNLSAADLVLSGSDVTDMTLTAAADGFYRIAIENTDSLTVSSGDVLVTQTVTTQGSEVFVISNEFTKFSYEETVDTVDVTAISEYDGTDVAVKRTMSFDATIYDADEDFTLYVLEAGQSGTFTVYKKGKVAGYEVFEFVGLLESVGKDFPDHEKLEISISGMRQGAMVVPFGSIYRP